MGVNGGWVLEVDIRQFFDTIDHTYLREFVSRRVRDGALRRLIGKWLKAGVLEDGELSFSETGTRSLWILWHHGGSVCQLGAEILSGNGRKQVESPKNQWRRMIKSV